MRSLLARSLLALSLLAAAAATSELTKFTAGLSLTTKDNQNYCYKLDFTGSTPQSWTLIQNWGPGCPDCSTCTYNLADSDTVSLGSFDTWPTQGQTTLYLTGGTYAGGCTTPGQTRKSQVQVYIDTSVTAPTAVVTEPTPCDYRVVYRVPPGTAGVEAGSYGDPHLSFAHGGIGDFKGEHGKYFVFHSSANASLAVRFKNATFLNHQEWPKKGQKVHGTYITEAHAAFRTPKGQLFNVSFHSDMVRAPSGEKGGRPGFINGTCTPAPSAGVEAAAEAFELDVDEQRTCDGVVASVDSKGALTLTTDEWIMALKPNDIYHMKRFETWTHKLDVGLTPRIPEADMKVKPHGIIGQSFDGDGIGINGKQDNFTGTAPGPTITTSAMAEGSLEGDAYDYMVPSKYATDFKFSRFDKRTAPFRDISGLTGSKVKLVNPTNGAGAFNKLEGQIHMLRDQPRVEIN